MFKLKNNRLYYGGVSFSLPDGLYINTNSQIIHENGFEFMPKDKSFCLVISFITFDGNETAAEYTIKSKQYYMNTNNHVYGDKHSCLKSIKRININGLNGFGFFDKDSFEAYFDSVTGTNVHLTIYIDANNIKEILNRQDVKKFFADIKIERKRPLFKYKFKK